MDDGGSGLVVLGFRDPHLLEGRETGEDTASDPHTVLALRRCYDLDLMLLAKAEDVEEEEEEVGEV